MAMPAPIAILAVHPVARAALWLALILALAAGALWLVRRLRDVEVDDTQDASKLLTKFRDLHSGGGLSDDEYRTIKTKLATQLQAETGTLSGDAVDGEECGDGAGDE